MSIRDNSATAVWLGSLKEGNGSFSASSGAFTDNAYTFASRFSDGLGTNPEELIAAAHAACFSMALSAQLGERGITPEAVETKATVTLGKDDQGPRVTKSHLEVVATITEGDEALFNEAAQAAKAGCPISRLLNAEITMDAKLQSEAPTA